MAGRAIGLARRLKKTAQVVEKGLIVADRGAKAAQVIKKGVTVIGPRNTYRQYAKQIGAKCLNVTNEAYTWRKNRRFLRGVVDRGEDVVFAGKFDPARLEAGGDSPLRREIRYLIKRGYEWTEDYSRLVKK